MSDLSFVVVLGILLISLYIGRISPNGFRRDFPLALLLSSQVYIFLELLIGIGYSIFVGLPLILGFWGANIAHESVNSSKIKENSTGFFDSFWALVAYALYSLIVLTRVIGSINLVYGNMGDIVLLVSVYSLVLPPIVSVFPVKFFDRRRTLSLFLVTFYYAIIGYTTGYLLGWGLVGISFLVVLYVGVLLMLWASPVFKCKPGDGEIYREGSP